jgi:hypothetical protein
LCKSVSYLRHQKSTGFFNFFQNFFSAL